MISNATHQTLRLSDWPMLDEMGDYLKNTFAHIQTESRNKTKFELLNLGMSSQLTVIVSLIKD